MGSTFKVAPPFWGGFTYTQLEPTSKVTTNKRDTFHPGRYIITILNTHAPAVNSAENTGMMNLKRQNMRK
jgi:hypothetical protein